MLAQLTGLRIEANDSGLGLGAQTVLTESYSSEPEGPGLRFVCCGLLPTNLEYEESFRLAPCLLSPRVLMR